MELNAIVHRLEMEEMTGWAVMLLVIVLSLVQISPLRLNPWDAVFHWLGRKLNGGVEEKMTALQRQVRDLWINSHRHAILTFARECRTEVAHNADEWYNILNICEEYESFTERNAITNGVVRENTRYIRELYQQLSREHRI